MKNQVLSAVIVSAICFAIGVAAGWNMLIAPSDGQKGFFDINNIEILLICGLIPAFFGAILGWSVYRLIQRRKETYD